VAPSKKPAALAARLVRLNDDAVKRLQAFDDVLVKEIKLDVLPILEQKIRDYRYIEDDRKAESLHNDIAADLKATTQNIFAIQKYARELVALGEEVERAADYMYRQKQDIDSKLYQAENYRVGNPDY
jgi:hypothetical protein